MIAAGYFTASRQLASRMLTPRLVDGEGSHGTSVLEDGGLARAVEGVHDVCVVRALEVLRRSPLDDRRFGELGHRVFQVSDSVAGEPDRVNANQPRSVEDLAQGHHAFRLCPVRGLLHEAHAQA